MSSRLSRTRRASLPGARRIGAALLLTGSLVAVVAPPAGAHAMLTASQPSDGALLERAPDEVVLEFTEAVDPQLTRVEVRDTTGSTVDAGAAETLSGDATHVRVPLPALDDGTYTVTYRTLSAVDGHVTSGALAFAVGAGTAVPAAVSAGAAAPTAAPSVLAVASRWSLYWGLALLLGAAVVALAVFSGSLPAPRWALLLPLVAAAAGLLGLVAAESRAAEVDPLRLLSSAAGLRLLREAVALAVTAVAVVVVIARRSRPGLVLLGLAAAATMLAHTLTGHAGAPGDLRVLHIAVQWVHVVAVGVWVGGLAWLLVGLRTEHREHRAARVRRFSAVATLALGPVAITGALRALELVGGWEGLVSTGYGRTVLAKVALFLPLLALGALNRFRLVPALSHGEPRARALSRSIGGELWLAAGVLAVTGIMAGLPPPAPMGGHTMVAAAGPSVEVTGSDFATSVRAMLRAAPGTAGPNRFDVRIEDFDSGEPLDARRVSLRFTLPSQPEIGSSTLPLQQQAPGEWTGTGTQLSVVGRWDVAVLIEQSDDSVEVPLQLQPEGVEVVEVDMVNFAFQPDDLTFAAGDTVRFRFTNSADVVHEAVIGDAHVQAEHEQLMAEGGDAEHHGEVPAVEVGPGETKELTHTFDEPGTLLMGCHEPGHYEAGMVATIVIE